MVSTTSCCGGPSPWTSRSSPGSKGGVPVRPAANSVVTLHYVTRDAGDRIVVEQWWSTVWLGVTCRADGAAPPAHAFPDEARNHPIGSWDGGRRRGAWRRRYAEVSGDWSAHHFDEAAARRSGSERPFLHGLCTLALCTQGAVEMAADGNVGALERIAVRFARPMPLGGRLDLQLYRAGPNEVAFEAQCGDLRVVSNGRARVSVTPGSGLPARTTRRLVVPWSGCLFAAPADRA